MRFFFMTLSWLLLFANRINAQVHDDYTSNLKNANYLKCIMVTLDLDSIPALMENYPEVYKMYGDKNGKVAMILSTTGRQTLKADEFKGYELTLKNRKVKRFFCIDGTVVQVKYAGEKIKLFEREAFVLRAPKHAMMISPTVRRVYLVRKKYEAYLTNVDDIADNQSLSAYFEDCPVLSQKIGQPKSKVRDIVSLVQRYDACAIEDE